MQAIIESARKTVDSSMKDDEALKQRAVKGMKMRMEKYGDDAKLCAPFPIPITIIGGKYDEFQVQNIKLKQFNSIQFFRTLILINDE